jgi:hypothetical protein
MPIIRNSMILIEKRVIEGMIKISDIVIIVRAALQHWRVARH